MFFYDAGKTTSRKITDEGFLQVEALVGRAGVQVYSHGDPVYDSRPANLKDLTEIRLLRPDSEVFDEKSLESFRLKPVTENHPPEMINASNVAKYQKGVIGSVTPQPPDLKFGLLVQDSGAIRAVEAGRVQNSLGYNADIDWTGGTDEVYGVYDGVMRNIKGNHVAIVDRARAGSAYRLFDAATNNEETKMSNEINDALIENGKLQAAITDANSQIATLKSQISDAETAKAGIAAELEQAKKQVITDAEIAVKVEAGIKDRMDVIDSARAVMPELDVAGKSATEIRLAVIDHLTGGKSKPDATNAELVASVYDAVCVVPRSKSKEISDALSAGGQNVNIVDAARQRMMDRKAGKETSK